MPLYHDETKRPRTRREIRNASQAELLAAVESGDWRYKPDMVLPDEPVYGRPEQLYRADLAGMNSDQIEAARLSGQLDDLQAGMVRPPDGDVAA